MVNEDKPKPKLAEMQELLGQITASNFSLRPLNEKRSLITNYFDKVSLWSGDSKSNELIKPIALNRLAPDTPEERAKDVDIRNRVAYEEGRRSLPKLADMVLNTGNLALKKVGIDLPRSDVERFVTEELPKKTKGLGPLEFRQPVATPEERSARPIASTVGGAIPQIFAGGALGNIAKVLNPAAATALKTIIPITNTPGAAATLGQIGAYGAGSAINQRMQAGQENPSLQEIAGDTVKSSALPAAILGALHLPQIAKTFSGRSSGQVSGLKKLQQLEQGNQVIPDQVKPITPMEGRINSDLHNVTGTTGEFGPSLFDPGQGTAVQPPINANMLPMPEESQIAGLLPGKTIGQAGQPGFREAVQSGDYVPPVGNPPQRVIPQPGPVSGNQYMKFLPEETPAFTGGIPSPANKTFTEISSPLEQYKNKVTKEGGAGNVNQLYTALDDASKGKSVKPLEAIKKQSKKLKTDIDKANQFKPEPTGNKLGFLDKVSKKIPGFKTSKELERNNLKADLPDMKEVKRGLKDTAAVSARFVGLKYGEHGRALNQIEAAATKFKVPFYKTVADEVGLAQANIDRIDTEILNPFMYEVSDVIKKSPKVLTEGADKIAHASFNIPIDSILDGSANLSHLTNPEQSILKSLAFVWRSAAQRTGQYQAGRTLAAYFPAKRELYDILLEKYPELRLQVGDLNKQLENELAAGALQQGQASQAFTDRFQRLPWFTQSRSKEAQVGSTDIIDLVFSYLSEAKRFTYQHLLDNPETSEAGAITKARIEAMKNGHSDVGAALLRLQDQLTEKPMHNPVAKTVSKLKSNIVQSQIYNNVSAVLNDLTGVFGLPIAEYGPTTFMQSTGLAFQTLFNQSPALKNILSKINFAGARYIRQGNLADPLLSKGLPEVNPFWSTLGLAAKSPEDVVNQYIQQLGKGRIELFGMLEEHLLQPIGAISELIRYFGGKDEMLTALNTVLKRQQAGENVDKLISQIVAIGQKGNETVNLTRRLGNKTAFEQYGKDFLGLLNQPLREAGWLTAQAQEMVEGKLTGNIKQVGEGFRKLVTYYASKSILLGTDGAIKLFIPVYAYNLLQKHFPHEMNATEGWFQQLDDKAKIGDFHLVNIPKNWGGDLTRVHNLIDYTRGWMPGAKFDQQNVLNLGNLPIPASIARKGSDIGEIFNAGKEPGKALDATIDLASVIKPSVKIGPFDVGLGQLRELLKFGREAITNPKKIQKGVMKLITPSQEDVAKLDATDTNRSAKALLRGGVGFKEMNKGLFDKAKLAKYGSDYPKKAEKFVDLSTKDSLRESASDEVGRELQNSIVDFVNQNPGYKGGLKSLKQNPEIIKLAKELNGLGRERGSILDSIEGYAKKAIAARDNQLLKPTRGELKGQIKRVRKLERAR